MGITIHAFTNVSGNHGGGKDNKNKNSLGLNSACFPSLGGNNHLNMLKALLAL